MTSCGLITVRSNDQFNTTVYGYHDRFRGIKGTRMVLFMNAHDIDRLGLRDGDLVTVCDRCRRRRHRQVSGLRVTPTTFPEAAAPPIIRSAIR